MVKSGKANQEEITWSLVTDAEENARVAEISRDQAIRHNADSMERVRGPPTISALSGRRLTAVALGLGVLTALDADSF